MIGSIPRFPCSLDPLMAEAKRRARQRRALVALGVVLLAGLAVGLTLAYRSPGGGPSGGAANGRLSGVTNPGSGSDGLGVTKGMTAQTVRATAGRPLRVVRSNPRNPDCWVYGTHLAVCFKYGRVDYVGP